MKILNHEPFLFFALDDGMSSGGAEERREENITIRMDEYAQILKERDELAKKLEEKSRIDQEKVREMANKIAVDKIRSEIQEKELDVTQMANKIAEIKEKARIYDIKLKDSNQSLIDYQRDYMRLLSEKFKVPFEVPIEREILDLDIKNLESIIQQSNLFKENYDASSRSDDVVDNTALAQRRRRENTL